MKAFDTKPLSEKADYPAPDTSEIRLLVQGYGGGLAHCRLPPGGITKAVKHWRVEELWFCLSGEGEFWRKQGERHEVEPICAGISLSIPVGTSFQFRNIGSEPLDFIIATLPPWEGEQDAIPILGNWENG